MDDGRLFRHRRRRHSTTNELVKGVPQLPRLSSESRSSEFSTYSSFDHDNDDDDNKIGDGDNDGDMTLEPEFSVKNAHFYPDESRCRCVCSPVDREA
ncbi:hypothetical protein RI054_05g30130 [Pseudoscourfieldia marina]